MINLEIFLVGLLIASTLTGLMTEAVKKVMAENRISYGANTVAGVVSLAVSAIIGIGYIFIANIEFSAVTVVYLLALMLMSWLCAMLGYDKVIQTIKQFKPDEKDDENE